MGLGGEGVRRKDDDESSGTRTDRRWFVLPDMWDRPGQDGGVRPFPFFFWSF